MGRMNLSFYHIDLVGNTGQYTGRRDWRAFETFTRMVEIRNWEEIVQYEWMRKRLCEVWNKWGMNETNEQERKRCETVHWTKAYNTTVGCVNGWKQEQTKWYAPVGILSQFGIEPNKWIVFIELVVWVVYMDSHGRVWKPACREAGRAAGRWRKQGTWWNMRRWDGHGKIGKQIEIFLSIKLGVCRQGGWL